MSVLFLCLTYRCSLPATGPRTLTFNTGLTLDLHFTSSIGIQQNFITYCTVRNSIVIKRFHLSFLVWEFQVHQQPAYLLVKVHHLNFLVQIFENLYFFYLLSILFGRFLFAVLIGYLPPLIFRNDTNCNFVFQMAAKPSSVWRLVGIQIRHLQSIPRQLKSCPHIPSDQG